MCNSYSSQLCFIYAGKSGSHFKSRGRPQCLMSHEYGHLFLIVINKFLAYFHKLFVALLTLHELGGTRSWVISPAWTQNLWISVPEYKSHKHTAKSTPPETRWDFSYRWCRWWGYNRQFTRPACPNSSWCGGQSVTVIKRKNTIHEHSCQEQLSQTNDELQSKWK